MQRRHIIGYPAVVVLTLGVGIWSTSSQPTREPVISSPVTSSTGTPADSAEPGNPVPILKKITGCILEAGAKNGTLGLSGSFRVAGCHFMDNGPDHFEGTGVGVTTYPGDPKQFGYELTTPSDGTDVILGSNFVVSITYVAGSTSSPAVDLKKISTEVGGQVVQ